MKTLSYYYILGTSIIYYTYGYSHEDYCFKIRFLLLDIMLEDLFPFSILKFLKPTQKFINWYDQLRSKDQGIHKCIWFGSSSWNKIKMSIAFFLYGFIVPSNWRYQLANFVLNKNSLFKLFIRSGIEFSGRVLEADTFFRQSFDVMLHRIRFDV